MLSGNHDDVDNATKNRVAVLPRYPARLGEQVLDADWFRDALAERGIDACSPARPARRNPAEHDANFYRGRYRVENLFARFKDWRRIATRYD